jgi:hypothetical protein
MLVVEHITICGSTVIAAHPVSNEILALRAISEKIPTSYLVHLQPDLSLTWQEAASSKLAATKETSPVLTITRFLCILLAPNGVL